MELKIVDAPFGIVLVIDDHRRAGASSEPRTTQSGSQRRVGSASPCLSTTSRINSPVLL